MFLQWYLMSNQFRAESVDQTRRTETIKNQKTKKLPKYKKCKLTKRPKKYKNPRKSFFFAYFQKSLQKFQVGQTYLFPCY